MNKTIETTEEWKAKIKEFNQQLEKNKKFFEAMEERRNLRKALEDFEMKGDK